MKKLLFMIFLIVSLFGADDFNATIVDQIVSSIPKNSPEYSLDLLYAKKIKTLSYKEEEFDITKINSLSDYLKAFYQLIDFEKFILDNEKRVKDLNSKTDLLSVEKDPTQKLEYLYYKKLINIQKKRYNYLNSHIKKWRSLLYQKLFDIKIDIKKTKSNINYNLNKLKSTTKKLEKLKIELEKWKIANSKDNIAYVKNLIKNNLKRRLSIYKAMEKSYIIIFLKDIKLQDKNAFKVENSILKYVALQPGNNINAYKNILHYYEKESFGSTQLFINRMKDEIKFFFEKSWSILNYPLFNVDNKNISLINFFIFIVILLLGSMIGKYYKKSVISLKGKYDISNSNITLLTNIGYYLILIVAFLLSLKSIGLDLSSFTLIAGALSVGIGFGLQNIVSNFVSGIILMFEKSIKIGDYIQIDEDTRGSVVDIKMRSITIRTNDNIDLIVPNQNFIQNTVINWTLNDKSRRFRIPFGVSYGTSVEDVEKVVLEAIKKTNFPHYKIGKKKPQIIFTSLGDNSINFELFIWVKDELTFRPRYTTSEFLKIIYKALNDAGISIPFPQQDLYVKELPAIKIEKSSQA